MTAGKWTSTALVGALLGGGTDLTLHSETATPSSVFWASVGGALGGATKLAGNAYLGLPNQWIPTNLANFGTALLGSQVVGSTGKDIGNASTIVIEAPWWNTPIKDMIPSQKR